MSITLLIKQNVYRYYALTDHTLSLLFTRHQVCFSVFMCHLFFNGVSPAFVFTSVISHLFEPQRLEMVMVDTTDRRFLPLGLRYAAAQTEQQTKHIHPL